MKNHDTLYLVDGSSYLYRAFHAVPNLSNSAGQPTGALFGVANMLRRLLNQDRPRYAAVVFDAKGKTFRHEKYPAYKANRPPMPEELRSQVGPILQFVEAMGFPLLQVDGVEADDVIGTLATEAADAGMNCVISTGDKDMAQLVGDRVTLVNTMTETTMDRNAVIEKFGVPPERIIDWLALVGDTADNIPGVEKCGPKTAVKWLTQFGDLDQLMQRADEVKGKVGENLRTALDHLPLSRDLATIRTQLELPYRAGQLAMRDTDLDALAGMLRQYEFSSWLAELDAEDNPNAGESAAEYETILDRDAFVTWLERLMQADLVAVDTETTSLDYMQAELVGFSFSTETGHAAYLPLAHDYPDAPSQLDRDWVLGELKAWLEDPDKAKVGQHLKYDINVLRRHGIELAGVKFDTMLESYVLDSTATRHDMDSLALKYLGRQTIHYEDVAGKGKNQLTFNQIPMEQASEYAAEDADITLQLHQALWPKLKQLDAQAALFHDIEIALIPVLSRMETTGVLIDGEELQRQSRELAEQMLKLEARAHKLAGHPFNLGSPKQLQQILFEELELPVIRKTPKGQPSTAEDVLHELATDYELPQIILDFRSVSKLKSTYTDRLPERIDPDTGRVHTSYHQAVAATGRLSSTDPNLQNIPIRTPQGRRIRTAFIAPPGNLILAADYSQIELRIMAHLSGDDGLLNAFRNDVDIHRATAGEVFGETYEAVSADQRRAAKAINFGLMYGMSAFGLSKQLNIHRAEAQAYIDTYFERYPGVKQFMDGIREQAHEDGYVETLFGRRLWLRDINARNAQMRQAAERAAINAPMQGTAADIIKRAMIRVDRWIQAEQLPARLIMQVHDELVFEVAEKALDDFRQGVIDRMEAAADLNVRLVVDAGIGPNWEAAH